MIKLLRMAVFLCCLPLAAWSTPDTNPDPFKALKFLEGTWQASATGGSAGAATGGSYSFQTELDGHILARHSTNDPNCKAPADFDCKHGDLLYVFQDAPGQALKAIYFDNEGHVIHYDVAVPTTNLVVFLSEPGPGPKFKLSYELKSEIMSGKFQMQAPGQTEWHSYLEWSGTGK